MTDEDPYPKPVALQEGRVIAATGHALALLGPLAWWFGIVVPGINLVGPLVVLMGVREPSAFANRHLMAAVNFNATTSLAGVVVTLLSFSRAGTVVAWICAIAWTAAVVWAIRCAVTGKDWKPVACLPLARDDTDSSV